MSQPGRQAETVGLPSPSAGPSLPALACEAGQPFPATYHVEAEEAARYRAAAASLGLELSGDTFDVDRAGVCPALLEALARASRPLPRGSCVWIVLGEQQSAALHTSERFSFESDLLERLYTEGRGFLRAVTQTEALAGVLTIAPAAATTLEELTAMEAARVELSTASGALSKLMELADLDAGLEKPENFLSRPYIQRMVELAGEMSGRHGGLSRLQLPPLAGELGAFCAPLLGSVYYFPGGEQDLLVYPPPYAKPDLGDTYRGLALAMKLSSPHLMQSLQTMGFIRFDVELVNVRMEEIENEVLLSAGINPLALSVAERGRAAGSHRASLPRTWHELAALQSLQRRKEPVAQERLAQLSEETRVKLAAPARDAAAVARLLSELDHIDYPRFHRYNRLRFVRHFADYSDVKKQFVLQRVRRAVPVPQAAPAHEPAEAADSDDITFL